MKKLMTLVLAVLGFAVANAETYYLVGQDGGGETSFFASSNPGGGIGWSLSQGGTVLDHTVAAGNDYMVPSGSALRTKADDDANAFLGDTLKLAGEIWFKKTDNAASSVKVLTFPKLIADGGTLNNEKTDLNAFELAGALEIPEGKTLTVLNQGDTTTKTRNFKISSTTTGSGTLFVSLGGGSTSGTSSKLELSGDWSEFTGQIAAASGKTKYAAWTFIISGAFGGAIGEMPDRSSNPNYIINLADNPDGIRIAGTGDALPTCLRYRTCFYGADFANGTDINLLRVPKSVRAKLEEQKSELQFKWAGSYNDAVKGMQTGSPSPTAIDVSKISFVDNRDGTETYVYNRTTFYEKLANDTRKIDASSYATGGDYIYKTSNDEYIHVFKNDGTFTPNKDLTEVQVLVVGGGGAGGYASGGGGGAGGLVYQTDVSFTSGADYTVTVGAGGAKKTSSGSGNNGGASSIGDIVAAGGGGGAGKNSAGIAGGSGGGGSGGGRSGGAGTAVLGSAGGAGCAASNDAIGGGGGGAGEVGWMAGTLGPGQTSESVYNAGCGGNGREIGTAILGYAQYFAGGGGGGTAGGVKRYGIGGFGGGGVGGYDVNNVTFQTPGEDGLGGGGGGGAVDWGPTDGKDHNGAAGGKGIVIVRYPTPVDAEITEITGTIVMPDWKEDETPSEPDLAGLTVTPEKAAQALLVKYYADADCTQALDAKPILAGTYYVRAEIEKTRWYTAAVSEKTEFTIEPGEKTVVPIPTVSSFVYDGTPKTCVKAGDGYTIDSASTVTATGAGNYSVTLKLNDPETSQWSDLTSADKVIPWSIAQAENEWTTEAAIDKTEWMKTLDEPGKLTAPVAKFGPIVATLNGQDWDGVLPTEVGSYTAKWTVEETANYTGLEVTISFKVKPDFHTNAWKTEPTISKTSWKSTEEPATITPAEAAYGNDTMSVKISVDNGQFVDWDGKVPTTKGAYKIQWVVEETESYSRLEKTIEFLVDCRYCPTHPFMCLKSGEDEWKGGWKGANTIADAVNLAGQNGMIEVCKDVDVSALLNLTMNVSLCSNKDDKGARYTITVTADSSFGIYNNGKLTLSNIAFNLLPSANISKFASLGISANNMGGTLEVKDNVEIFGKVTGPLIQNVNGNNGTLYAHLTINGGTIKDLTAGYSLISAPGDASFSVKNLTIENCTVSTGALIAAGNKTLNLSNVTITNNTTTAGAITVNYVNELTNGVIKVSGDVIVKDNKVGDDAKNIVLKNAANLQMTGALGANASVGVSFGAAGDVFGAFTMSEATKEDKRTAAKFFSDAKPGSIFGRVNANNDLFWYTSAGTLLMLR